MPQPKRASRYFALLGFILRAAVFANTQMYILWRLFLSRRLRAYADLICVCLLHPGKKSILHPGKMPSFQDWPRSSARDHDAAGGVRLSRGPQRVRRARADRARFSEPLSYSAGIPILPQSSETESILQKPNHPFIRLRTRRGGLPWAGACGTRSARPSRRIVILGYMG